MDKRASGKRIAVFRRPEINRIAESRYGRELPDSEEGRRVLRVMVHYAAHAPKPLTVAGVVDHWAPWLKKAERELFETEAARSAPPRDSPEQIAERLGVTYAERQKLGLKTIGACDVSRQARDRLRKLRRAEQAGVKRAEERQRRALQDAATKAWSLDHSRQEAIRFALSDLPPWSRVADIAARVTTWAKFKNLKPRSLRRTINRELDRLQRDGIVSSKYLPTPRKFITVRAVILTERNAPERAPNTDADGSAEAFKDISEDDQT